MSEWQSCIDFLHKKVKSKSIYERITERRGDECADSKRDFIKLNAHFQAIKNIIHLRTYFKKELFLKNSCTFKGWNSNDKCG
jgi:hypothetical protein